MVVLGGWRFLISEGLLYAYLVRKKRAKKKPTTGD